MPTVADNVDMLNQTNIVSWGIDRLDGFVDGTYANIGQGGNNEVTVYLVDSGVNIKHQDFKKYGNVRADEAANFVTDEDASDQLGHGTINAGIIGGQYSGVAKQVKVVSVKIVDRTTTGSL